MRRKNHQTGFTLIELMVVLLIIGLMLVVLVTNLNKLLGKRGLNMVASTLSGYFETIRGEAVNAGDDLLIVIIPAGEAVFTVADANGSQRAMTVGPGIYPFIVNPQARKDMQPWERLMYMGRDLVFENKFNSLVIHEAKYAQWQGMKYPLFPRVLQHDLEAIGIPKGAMLYFLQSDGRVNVPGDVPGFIIDAGAIDRLDGDLIFRDQSAAVFLDVSPLFGVRATEAINAEQLTATPWHFGGP